MNILCERDWGRGCYVGFLMKRVADQKPLTSEDGGLMPYFLWTRFHFLFFGYISIVHAGYCMCKTQFCKSDSLLL